MKKCLSCAKEVQDEATICHFCKKSFPMEDEEETSEEEPVSFEAPERKKWLKTLLISVATIFFILALLFGLAGFLDGSSGTLFSVIVLGLCFFIAVIGGGLLTYYNHFRATVEATVNKIEYENAWELGKMAFIRLLLGFLIIYWRVSGSEGFLRGEGFFVVANNIWNLFIWVSAAGLILAGIESLYWMFYYWAWDTSDED